MLWGIDMEAIITGQYLHLDTLSYFAAHCADSVSNFEILRYYYIHPEDFFNEKDVDLGGCPNAHNRSIHTNS